MNSHPIIKPVVIVLGVLVALFVVGKFLAPKDPAAEPTPAAQSTPAASGAEDRPAEAKGMPGGATNDGEKAKLGPGAVTTKTGLKYEDLKVGTGKEAKEGTTVQVHYTGWLTDGKKFDASKDHGQPFELTLPGQVIAGWNEGIPGMKEGGTRKLVIPAALGYGEQGQGEIPPGATLVFEVELLKVN